MSEQQQKSNNIEKFTGTFSKQAGGCSIVINQTINSITNMDALGLYTYLICRPDNWILNPKHLANHFDCGRDKLYKCLDILISKGVLKRTEVRDKGRFCQFHYEVLLQSNIEQFVHEPPLPEKPDTDKPDTENPHTYKTKKVLNKEGINNLGKNELKPVEYQETYFENKTADQAPDLFIHEQNLFGLSRQSLLDFESRVGRKSITITKWMHITRELRVCWEAGYSPQEAFDKYIASEWKSFSASYIIVKNKGAEPIDHDSTDWAKNIDKDLF